MSRALYEKRGRRYVPVVHDWDDSTDRMRVGEFRLTYCYRDGARRYEYAVTPATAAWVAAAEIAREAMEAEIAKAAASTANLTLRAYTQRHLKIIERFRAEMVAAGGMLPQWWNQASARDIATVGVEAVRMFKP
jgi:hypothetical protein